MASACISDQLEELRHLQVESEEEAQTLRQVAEEAGAHSLCDVCTVYSVVQWVYTGMMDGMLECCFC